MIESPVLVTEEIIEQERIETMEHMRRMAERHRMEERLRLAKTKAGKSAAARMGITTAAIRAAAHRRWLNRRREIFGLYPLLARMAESIPKDSPAEVQFRQRLMHSGPAALHKFNKFVEAEAEGERDWTNGTADPTELYEHNRIRRAYGLPPIEVGKARESDGRDTRGTLPAMDSVSGDGMGGGQPL